MNVDISYKGAVLLGQAVVCDGFNYAYPVRVQTHIHEDHMVDFDSSKGLQDIFMSEATRDLLVAKRDADLPHRTNISAIPLGEPFQSDGIEILLLDNGHMLGSVQVAVTVSNGLRVGYSGDFDWPLPDVIRVDELVVDSTHGSPDSRRAFTQEEANGKLIELFTERINFGPVVLKAHPGTLQRAISSLSGFISCPVIAGTKIYQELEVYRKYGYYLADVMLAETEDAKLALRNRRYLHLCGFYERQPANPIGTTITLSAYWSGNKEPIARYSESSFGVALSDHADYDGTMEYIRATGAKRVLTDNTRGGHAIELAQAVRHYLGIDAEPSQFRETKDWGS